MNLAQSLITLTLLLFSIAVVAGDSAAQQAYLKASNTGSFDGFGISVSVSGDTVVVGAVGEASNATGVNGNQSDNSTASAGAVYVFVRSGLTWTQQAYLKASNSSAGDEFGSTVSLSGNTLVVGAAGDDSNATGVNGDQSNNTELDSGAAYIFVRSGTTWTQQAYLKASNTTAGDVFGQSVSISGDTVVVGAYQESSNATGVNGAQNNDNATNSGAAYVFVRSGTTWSQQAYLKASNTQSFDRFGYSVSVSANTIAVGADQEDSSSTGVNGNQSNNDATDSGAAYVFVRDGTTWSQQAYLKASNTGINDWFGGPVTVSVDTVLVGAIQEDSNATGVNGSQVNNTATQSGAAYVFVRSGTTWTQQAYLKASNTGASDQFGNSISMSGNTVVIGAWQEASNASGVNGNQSNNSAAFAGAAYVFTRSGTVWSQQAYLKASNTGASDQFGYSVCVSGDFVVAGARFEGSSATGVNGDQGDDSASASGAAYVFELDLNPGIASYGTGTPGCAGTQTLSVNHAPMINSPHFIISCDNAPPLSLGLAIITDSQDLAGSDPFGLGVLLHADLIFPTEVITLDFYSDGTGYSETVGATIPNNPTIVGNIYYACALWAWPTSICTLPGFNPYNLSTSRGLALTILVP